jgi:hypothetical protein
MLLLQFTSFRILAAEMASCPEGSEIEFRFWIPVQTTLIIGLVMYLVGVVRRSHFTHYYG